MSERYKTADELLARHIRDMGDELGRVYTALSTELSRLQVKWHMYRQLYGKSQERLDVLHQAAGHFFSILHQSLIGDVVLHLSRLTDRPRTAGRESLTIQRLPALLPDETLQTDVAALVTAARTACAPVRPWRDWLSAHTDLQVAISSEPVPGISRAQIETAIVSVRAVLNRIEVHYWNSPTRYDLTMTPVGDADSLVYYLVNGLRT
jgi:hypothetical protein